MYHLDVELAMGVFRQLGDASMVWSLQSIQHIEDKSLLAGHILVSIPPWPPNTLHL